MTVKCVVSLTMKADQEDFFLDAVKNVINNSRKAEGCILSVLHKAESDLKGDVTYIILEEWADSASYDKDLDSAHVKEFMEQVKGKVTVEVTKLTLVEV